MGDFVFPPLVWPPRIVLDGQTLRFVPVSNHSMLMWISAGAWMNFIPQSLAPEDRQHIYRRLHDTFDNLEVQHLHNITKDLIAGLCGTTPGASQRIAEHTLQSWFSFDGWCIINNFDPHTAPFHRLISAGYQFWTATLDSTDKNAIWMLNHKIWPEDEKENPAAEEHAIMAAVLGGMKPNEGILR